MPSRRCCTSEPAGESPRSATRFPSIAYGVLANGLGAASPTLVEELEDPGDAEGTARAADDARAAKLLGDLAELEAAEAHVAHDGDDVLLGLVGLRHPARR